MRQHYYLSLLACCLVAATSGCAMFGKSKCGSGCSNGACVSGNCCEDASGCGKGTCDGACGVPGCDGLSGRGLLPKLVANGRNHCAGGNGQVPPGPTMGAVTYPYYTTRGPRDFLLGNPPSIGR